MKIMLNDGKVVFAKYLVKVSLDRSDPRLYRALPHQTEPEGVYCYSHEELDLALRRLREMGKTYEIEALDVDQELVAKARGVKYGNSDEALRHLRDGKEPESLVIADLVARIENLEKKLGPPN